MTRVSFKKFFLQVSAFRPREEGSLLIVSALSMTLLLACLGVAIDVGHFRFAQRRLQAAADAAALAGALEMRECTGSSNCATMQTAAKDAVSENGLTVNTVLTQCSGTSGSGVTLTLNNPACESTSDPNYGRGNYVEAVVSEPVPTYFAKLIGLNSLTMTARAEASRGIGGPCIYALDPSGAAITILAGVIVKSKCDIVDESASSDALDCIVGVFLYAPSVNITGGSSGILCGIQAAPHTGVPVPNPPDPLSYLSAPSNASASCGTSTGSPYYGSSNPVNVTLGTVAFNPGVYCGGISITAALLSNVTFNPGTYILRDKTGLLGLTSGGLNITLSTLSTISGNGVTFYNEGPSGGFNITEPLSGGSIVSLSNFNLTAPSSGDYSGILFFQERGVSASSLFLANVIQGGNMQGAVYVPDGAVDYGVTALSSSYNILVAKDINFLATVASTFGDDYSSLSGGSPLNGNNVSLVQ